MNDEPQYGGLIDWYTIRPILFVLSIITILLLIMTSVHAVQPTQQYNKILLTPFYINAMTQNVQYNYSVNVITPDGISQVKTAILTLDAWISPTRTFNAWMNNVQCNTKNYTISTTYASAGRGVVTFDCTNAIIKNQNNTVRFVVSGGNIGASTGWLDLTYMNNPKGDLALHGTEYTYNQEAKIWLQLLDNAGQYIDDGICYLHVYTPDNQAYIEASQMTNMNHDGIYYYDLIIPLQQGIYPAIANCFYTAGETRYYPLTITIDRGTAVFTNLDSAYFIDGNFFRYTENAPNPRRVILNWTFPSSNISACAQTPEVLMTGLNIFVYATFDSVLNDDITISIFNWSSNSWIDLPNKILEGPGYKSASNFLSTNNITKSGYYNATNGIRLRTSDTNLTDTANNNFDVDQIYIGCDVLADPQWQDIKGSSEMHITSNKPYSIQFDSFSFSPEKINYYNITVGSATSGDVTTLIDIPIYYAYICGAIEEVRQEINGSYQVINWSYSKARETILDSCNIIVERTLSKGQNYYYSIKFDDKWQEYSEARLSRAEYLDEYIRAGCEFYRQSYSYPSYTVPLTTAPNESYGSQYSVCNYYFDSFYHMNNSVHQNIINKFSTTPVIYTDERLVKQTEADVLEIASLTEQLVVLADSIIQEWTVANSYSTTILGNTNITPEVIQYWSNISSSWALYNKNVTATVNTTLISESVWNYTNRTLTYYPPATVDTNAVASAVWNYTTRNLTYYPPQQDLTNYTLITNSVWSYTGSISQVIGDYIGFNTWNYTARYTHGVVLN